MPMAQIHSSSLLEQMQDHFLAKYDRPLNKMLMSGKETPYPSICLSLLLQGLTPRWHLACMSSLADGECSRKLWSSQNNPQ